MVGLLPPWVNKMWWRGPGRTPTRFKQMWALAPCGQPPCPSWSVPPIQRGTTLPGLHLMKLSVGTKDVRDLARWQSGRGRGPDGQPRHVTRMWPKREAELLDGGSIYWTIKGVILCRQRLLGLDEVREDDGILRCALILDPLLVRVTPTPRRPFQGWRYLPDEDAPRDLPGFREDEDELPPKLSMALAEFGVVWGPAPKG